MSDINSTSSSEGTVVRASSTGCKEDLRRIDDWRRSEEAGAEISFSSTEGVGAREVPDSVREVSSMLTSDIGSMDDLRRLFCLAFSVETVAGAASTGCTAICVLEASDTVVEGF